MHPTPTTDDGVSAPPGPEQLDTLFVLLLLCAFLLGIYSLFAWVVFPNPAERGQFGDSFGGANSIISLFTVVGLGYTIYLQRTELRLAHDEAAKQAVNVTRQRVESTFFNLVQMQASILSDLVVAKGNETLRGRAAFAYVQLRLRQIYEGERFGSGVDRWVGVTKSYMDLDREAGGVFGHYFRSLYHIVKFIDESALTDREKKGYTSIVRAHMSEDETIVFFFNCQTHRAESFGRFINRYALLEHLPKWDFDGDDLRLYDEAAYGTNEDLIHKRNSRA
jgi:hypothetical protein